MTELLNRLLNMPQKEAPTYTLAQEAEMLRVFYRSWEEFHGLSKLDPDYKQRAKNCAQMMTDNAIALRHLYGDEQAH